MDTTGTALGNCLYLYNGTASTALGNCLYLYNGTASTALGTLSVLVQWYRKYSTGDTVCTCTMVPQVQDWGHCLYLYNGTASTALGTLSVLVQYSTWELSVLVQWYRKYSTRDTVCTCTMVLQVQH